MLLFIKILVVISFLFASGIPLKSELSSSASNSSSEEETSMLVFYPLFQNCLLKRLLYLEPVQNERNQEAVDKSILDVEKSTSGTPTKVPNASRSIFYPSIDQCLTLEKDLQVT